jgi:GNAT superfamily N-acetyltransferase
MPDTPREPNVTLHLEDPEGEAARACHARYYAELDERFEVGFNPADAAYSGQAAPSNVRTVIVWRDGEAVGSGSLVIGKDGTGELKRMWVAPSLRGQGLARRILAFLEDVARQEGLSALRLDTNRVLSEAHALYRKAGYSEIARYSDNPYAHHWFGKAL